MKNNLLKEAIADADAIKKLAIENAKAALHETFDSTVRSMLNSKLQENSEDELEDDSASDKNFKKAKFKKHKDEDEKMDEKAKPEEDEDSDESFDIDAVLAEMESDEEEDEDEDEAYEGEEDEDEGSYDEAAEGEEDDEDEAAHAEEGEEDEEDESYDLEALLAEIDSEDDEDHEEPDGDEDEAAHAEEGEEDEEDEAYEGEEEDEDESALSEDALSDIVSKIKSLSKDQLKKLKKKWDEEYSPKAMRDPNTPGAKLSGNRSMGLGVDEYAEKKASSKQNPWEKEKRPGKAIMKGGKVGKGTPYGLAKESYNKKISKLTKSLNETNLLNAKLLYLNKIMKNTNLNESQKVKLINTFDKATTVKETKLIYEALSESFKVSSKKTINNKKSIKESFGFASKPVGTSTRKEGIINEDAQYARWQKLAGLDD